MEVLVTITAIGIIGAVAFVATGSVSNVAKGERLRSDVAILNSAIDTYLANGGTLDAATSPEAVLAKLKKQRDGADARRHTGGPSGRMIDPRIVAFPVSASDGQLRAVYDPAAKRFEVAGSGDGVRFGLDPALNERNLSTEFRKAGSVVYAGTDSWVWDDDHALTNPASLPNLTPIPVSSAPADSPPPSPADPKPVPVPKPDPASSPPADPRTMLAAPTLGPPGGSHPPGAFPLAVTIGNPPAPAAGKVMFATLFNHVRSDWAEYSGQTLLVPRDGSVWAKAVAVDTVNYRDSHEVYGHYAVPSPPKLPQPIFSLPGGAYPRGSFPISISLTNLPAPDLAGALYRINSGPWTAYGGTVAVGKNETLSARYVSKDPDAYRDSADRSDTFYPVATDLSGSVTGLFQNATGGPTLAHEFRDSGAFFSHGDPKINLGGEVVDAGEPNTLRFTPQGFDGVSAGTPFKIGELAYHNGTTFHDSHATGVQLQVSIGLSDPAQAIKFALNFDLVNTENNGDAATSADYVRITNLTQNIGLTIDGVKYTLVLGFGGTDSFGFSTANEFHVYEGATGTGTINGTFMAAP